MIKIHSLCRYSYKYSRGARAIPLLCSVDLPARAILLNMKQWNGVQGCLYCESTGTVLPGDHLHRYICNIVNPSNLLGIVRYPKPGSVYVNSATTLCVLMAYFTLQDILLTFYLGKVQHITRA